MGVSQIAERDFGFFRAQVHHPVLAAELVDSSDGFLWVTSRDVADDILHTLFFFVLHLLICGLGLRKLSSLELEFCALSVVDVLHNWATIVIKDIY